MFSILFSPTGGLEIPCVLTFVGKKNTINNKTPADLIKRPENWMHADIGGQHFLGGGEGGFLVGWQGHFVLVRCGVGPSSMGVRGMPTSVWIVFVELCFHI